MAYQVEISRKAQKRIDGLEPQLRERILRRLIDLETNPRPDGVKKLHDVPDGYRIRAGDWRIVYQIIDERLFILVLRIGHRSDVYRRM